MKVIRNLLIIAAIAVLVSQAYAWGGSRAPKADTFHGARYALQEDLWGFHYTLKLRHCSNPEPKNLTRVLVDRERSLVVYRCEP